MYIRDSINSNIRVQVRNFPKELIGGLTGISHPEDWFLGKLVAVDEIGLWLENPKLRIIKLVDDQGRMIAVADRPTMETTAHVLIRWEYVAGIVRVPADENVVTKINRIGL